MRAAKALRQLDRTKRESKYVEDTSSSSNSQKLQDTDEYSRDRVNASGDDAGFSDAGSPSKDDEMTLAADRKRRLARMARSEAREQARLEAERKAHILKRKLRAQNELYEKLAFIHENPSYYEHIPIKPGIDALKWLAPMREVVIMGKKVRRPGLDAVKINIPETVVYSDRYAGVPEHWLSTSSRDGCVVSHNLSDAWINKFAKRATTLVDKNAPTSNGSMPDLRRAVAVLKMGHWPSGSAMSNISRVIPQYSLKEALKAPTTSAGSVCIQGFVHSRGQHASVYRIVWNSSKPPSGWSLSLSDKTYTDREASSAPGHASSTRSGALVDDFLSGTHLASTENRAEDVELPITVFELSSKAIEEPVAETFKLVQYLERVKTKAGHLKFQQLVADFVRDRNDSWVFLQIKSFRVTQTTFERCQKFGIAHRDLLATSGRKGDFMTMAQQSSTPDMYGRKALQIALGKSHSSSKSRRETSEGKQCAFCGLRFVARETKPFLSSGGNPSRYQMSKDEGHSLIPGIPLTQQGSGKENDSQSADIFSKTVPNFGYTFTERMMLEAIKHMVQRGVRLHYSVCDELRAAFGSRQSGEATIRSRTGGSGMSRPVCRLCFEVQNSQRSIEALGRQFAQAMGVPQPLRSLNPKSIDSMVGPGKDTWTSAQGTGGPAVYMSSGILHRPDSNRFQSTSTARSKKSLSAKRSRAILSGKLQTDLPAGSIKPRSCHWVHVSDVPTSSFKYRLTLMFHEIQDFPDVVLDELDMELQYRMVEHVHRMAVAEPVQLGEIETEEKDEKGAKKTKPFILCPVRHVRMHYLAATEPAFSDHLTKAKVQLRLLVRARRGDAIATAKGTSNMSLASLVGHLGGGIGTYAKHTTVIPVEIPPLGTLLVRVSMGFSCLASMNDEELFADSNIRFSRVINSKGGIFWFPEDHFDLKPLPQTWMGSFNLDLEARARAVRSGKKDEKTLHETEMDIQAELEEKLRMDIERCRTQLIDELDRPELRVARQADDLSNITKTISEVDNLINNQSAHGRRSTRLLVAAHVKMHYTRLMQRAHAEERFIDEMEHHSGTHKENIHFKAESPTHSKNLLASNDLNSEFMIALEQLFQGFLRKSKKKRVRRFRRSGSLDGNARGERRIILSEEERVPSVNIEILISEASLRARSPEDVDEESSDDSVPPKRSPNSHIEQSHSNHSIVSAEVSEDGGSDKGKSVEKVMRKNWLALVSILDNMQAASMHHVRWMDIISAWNSQLMLRRRGAESNIFGKQNERSGNDPDAPPESILAKNLEDSACNSNAGGDDLPKNQSIERRWTRILAASLIFQSVLSQKKVEGLEKEMRLIKSAFLQEPLGVVDVSELRSFMRGVISSRKCMRSQELITQLEERMQSQNEPIINSQTKNEDSVANLDESMNEDDDHSQDAGTDTDTNTDTDTDSVLPSVEIANEVKADSNVENETVDKITDTLYYNARAVQRAAIEICIAIEACEVWQEVCSLYDNQQRDSTLVWGDFVWLVDHSYALRVDSFRVAAYTERARGNTQSFISQAVGSAYFLTCVNHGPTYHHSSDGRCIKCEKEAIEVEQLRLAMADHAKRHLNETEKSESTVAHESSTTLSQTRMHTRISNTVENEGESRSNAAPPSRGKARTTEFQRSQHPSPAIDSEQDASDMIEVSKQTEDEEDFRPKITTSQKTFQRPKRVALKKAGKSRPQSAPLQRRSKKKRRPLSASNRLRSSSKEPIIASLEARNRAREITKMRIAALEGSGKGAGSLQSEITKRQARLREQLELSNSKSRERHREIESHLRKVREAMQKQVKASILSNRKIEMRRQDSAVRHLATVSGSRKDEFATDRGHSVDQPLHKQPYMSGILSEEQDKLMAKVRGLVISEVSQPLSSMDPTVMAPMLKSALIKYARQDDLDAVATLLESGVDPDVRLVEEPRRTLLQEAGRTGRVGLAELLVSHGASIAAKDSDGLNVLYHCYNEGHGDLAERLVAMSARSMHK